MNPIARTLLGLCLCAPAALSQTAVQPVPLFAPLPGALDVQATTLSNVVRGIPVQLDLDVLHRARLGDVLRFPAFDGEVYDLRLRERELIPAVPGAFHWHVDVVGQPQGRCTITVVGDAVTAYLVPGDLRPSTIALQPAPGMTTLRELKAEGPTCACHTTAGLPRHRHRGHADRHTHPAGTPGGSGGGGVAAASSCTDNPISIQVLAVYENHARSSAGGDSQIQSILLNGLAQSSTVMQDSGVPTSFDATSVRHVSFDENSAMDVTLDHLTEPADGRYDQVHTWRRDEAADLVTLAVGDRSVHGSVLGIAWVPTSVLQLENPAGGFSVCEYNGITDYVLAHELGHNMGSVHDRDNSSFEPYQNYGYGYRDRFFNTVFDKRWLITTMAYSPNCICTIVRARAFSTPNRYVTTNRGDIYCGDANHNNVRLFLETRDYVANWGLMVSPRYDSPEITAEPQPRAACTGTQGNPVMMSVTATNAGGYAWYSRTPGGIWSSVPGQSGAELRFDVVTPDLLDKEYHCLVSGRCQGFATSQSALLSANDCGTRISLASSGGGYGQPVTPVGDFDGDGYRDFVISQPEDSGILWAISGRTLSVYDTIATSLSGAGLGTAVAQWHRRIVYSEPGHSGFDGQIQTASLGPSNSVITLVRGRDHGLTGVGRRLATGRYLDPNAGMDLVYTADDRWLVAFTSQGGARELWRVQTPARVDTLTVVGDADGDGYDDVVCGMPQANSFRGRIQVRSGLDGSLLNERTGGASQAGFRFGHAIAPLGDLDGDGLAEFAWSQPGRNSARGRVVVTSLDLTSRWRVDGAIDGEFFGYALSSTGDADGDGIQDVLVSSQPLSSNVLSRVVLLSGADGSVIRERTGSSNEYGVSIASVDLNGDRIPDDIVAEPSTWSVYVYDSPEQADPPSTSTYGRICPTSLGNLSRNGVSRDPRIDAQVTFTLHSAPPNTPAAINFGIAEQTLNLDGLGAPGCQALVQSFASETFLSDDAGHESFTITIPDDPSLVGGILKTQWLVIDGAANQLGLVASNGASLRLGAR